MTEFEDSYNQFLDHLSEMSNALLVRSVDEISKVIHRSNITLSDDINHLSDAIEKSGSFWQQAPTAFGSALAGAFVGALLAFLLEVYSRKSQERAKSIDLIYKTVRANMSSLWLLANFKTQILNYSNTDLELIANHSGKYHQQLSVDDLDSLLKDWGEVYKVFVRINNLGFIKRRLEKIEIPFVNQEEIYFLYRQDSDVSKTLMLSDMWLKSFQREFSFRDVAWEELKQTGLFEGDLRKPTVDMMQKLYQFIEVHKDMLIYIDRVCVMLHASNILLTQYLKSYYHCEAEYSLDQGLKKTFSSPDQYKEWLGKSYVVLAEEW